MKLTRGGLWQELNVLRRAIPTPSSVTSIQITTIYRLLQKSGTWSCATTPRIFRNFRRNLYRSKSEWCQRRPLKVQECDEVSSRPTTLFDCGHLALGDYEIPFSRSVFRAFSLRANAMLRRVTLFTDEGLRLSQMAIPNAVAEPEQKLKLISLRQGIISPSETLQANFENLARFSLFHHSPSNMGKHFIFKHIYSSRRMKKRDEDKRCGNGPCVDPYARWRRGSLWVFC